MGNNGNGIKTLTAFEIPVEIFIIFLVQNKKGFTVQDVIIEFKELHKVEITYNRMKQILDQFVESEKLDRDKKPAGSKNKDTMYYTFKKLF